MNCYLCLYKTDYNTIPLMEGSLEKIDKETAKYNNSDELRKKYVNAVPQCSDHSYSVRVVTDLGVYKNGRTKINVLYKQESYLLNRQVLVFEMLEKLFRPEYEEVFGNLIIKHPDKEFDFVLQTAIAIIKLLNSEKKVKRAREIRNRLEDKLISQTDRQLLQKELADSLKNCHTLDTLQKKHTLLNEKKKKLLRKITIRNLPPIGQPITLKLFSENLMRYVSDYLYSFFENSEKSNTSDRDASYLMARKIYSKIKSYEKRTGTCYNPYSVKKEDSFYLYDSGIRDFEVDDDVSAMVKKYEETI